MAATQHSRHVDDVDTKLRLLAEARARGDSALALALADSLKDTLATERQQAHAHPSTGQIDARDSGGEVAALPEPWRAWAAGWRWYVPLALAEPAGLAREQEPVILHLRVPASQLRAPRRELRVAALVPAGDGALPLLREIPSQVLAHSLDGDSRLCQLCFFADVQAGGSARFLVLHGNPAAELPAYPSPLRATGEGLGLTVSNEHFSAELSPNHGGLRTLRVHGDPGIVLTAVGNGHGEEPGFDWGNGGDFLDRAPEGTPGWQKFRITNWERPPNSW